MRDPNYFSKIILIILLNVNTKYNIVLNSLLYLGTNQLT